VPTESPRVFDVLTWQVSGELPFKHTSRGDVNASRALTTWRLVYEVLKDVLAAKKQTNKKKTNKQKQSGQSHSEKSFCCKCTT